MIDIIINEQRRIVLQDLCKNFIPYFLEQFNDCLTKNTAGTFSKTIKIDKLLTLDENNRRIKIKQSGINIYAPIIYQEFSDCLLKALRDRFGESYTITLKPTAYKALDKDIYGRATPMWSFSSTYTFTSTMENDMSDKIGEQVDADFLFQSVEN